MRGEWGRSPLCLTGFDVDVDFDFAVDFAFDFAVE